MPFADLHTHTALCRHAGGRPEEYLKKAQEHGLRYLGVSDHIPWPDGYDTDSRMSPDQYPLYRALVRDLQAKAADSGIEVLYGIELDWVPGRMEEVARPVKEEPYDYRLGSVHFVGDFGFDSEAELDKWEKIGTDTVWMRYAALMCDFVQGFDFDVMTHPDLPKKFGHRPSDFEAFLKHFREALVFAGERGIAIELNTAGWRKPVREQYPSLEILKAAHEAGMPLTFGSDAHAPCDVAYGFEQAAELAREAGYRTILAFKNRKPVELPLDPCGGGAA